VPSHAAVRHRMFDRATPSTPRSCSKPTIAVTGLQVSEIAERTSESAILQNEVFNALTSASGGRVAVTLTKARRSSSSILLNPEPPSATHHLLGRA